MKEKNLLTPCNSLLVVGNGFDIGLHLPTRYTDFMKHFLMYRCALKKLPMPAITKEDDIDGLHELFVNKMNSWRSNYKNERTDKLDINAFDNTIFRNKLILILIFKYNPNELFRLSGTFQTGVMNRYGSVTLYPNGLNNHYFLGQEIKGSDINWFNVEEILLEISIDEKYQKIIDEINNKSGNSSILSQNQINIMGKNYDELKNGLIFLKASLSIYLLCVQEIYLKTTSEQTKKYFQEICNTLDYRRERYVNEYSEVISLNYTKSAEMLFGSLCATYPHGRINPTCPEKSEIVLGFYDRTTENDYDTSFIDFQKLFQRNFYERGNYETKDSEILYIDFYGFSCDPADTELIQCLITRHEEVRRIRIFCYKNEGKEQNMTNLIKCIGQDKFRELLYKNKLKFKLIP